MAGGYNIRISAEGLETVRKDFEALAKTSPEFAAAFDKLKASAPIFASNMERARQEVERTTQALDRSRVANDSAASSTGRLGQAAGQAGFQIQDFANQVAGGQSAVLAFSQQMSQLLGVFGTGGAIAGAALSVGLLATQFLSVGDATEEAKRQAEGYRDSLKELNELLETSWQRSVRLRQASIDAVIAPQERIREAATARGEQLGGQILTLEEQLATAERARATTLQADPEGRGLVARRQQSVIDELRRNLESLRGQAEVTRKEVEETTRVINQARGVSADPTLYEAGRGTVFPADTVESALQRQRDKDKQEAERRQREGEAEQKRIERDALALQATWDNYFDQAEKRAEDRATREAERRQKEAEEAAQRAAEQEEKRRQAEIDQTTRQYSSQLARGTTDALFDGFKKGESAAQALANVAERALRTAVAGALDTVVFRPLIQPVVASVIGGGLGTAGGSEGTGTGLVGGLAQSLGINAIGSQLSSALGLSGAGSFLSGLGGQIDAAGVSSGLFGNGISPLAQGPTLTGEPLGALSQSGLFGSSTLTSAIGGVGLGFGAGALAGNIVGGIRGTVDPTGGLVGAGLGAAAGFLIGGPVGALIGGVVGGAGGSLFGPTKQGLADRSGGSVRYGVQDGRLVILGAAGKRWDEAGARASTQQQLDAVNNALAARGLTISSDLGADYLGFGKAATRAGGSSTLDFSDSIWALRPAREDGNLSRVLSVLTGGGYNLDNTLSNVDWYQQVYKALSAAPQTSAEKFQAQLDALAKSFEDATEKARYFGLAEDALARNRDRQTQALRDQRDLTGLQLIQRQQGTLTGFLDQLDAQFASPETRLTSAQDSFARALSAARNADIRTADLGGLTGAAGSLLAAGRAYYGTGGGFGELDRFVRSSVESIGRQLDLPAFGGNLEASLSAAVNPLKDEMALLRDQVERLREELRATRIRAAA